MQKEWFRSTVRLAACLKRIASTAMAVTLCVTVSGCLSSLARHSTAVATATAPVIDQAISAYRSANQMHDAWLDDDAVARFDRKDAVYNPETTEPLLSDRGIEVRLAVLIAFKTYVESLVAITNGTDTPQMRTAAAAAGGNLTRVANLVAPSIERTLGMTVATGATIHKTVAVTTGTTTTTTTSTSSALPPPTLSPGMRNGISTAADALGQFLVSRKIKKELPRRIREMDPQLEQLCRLLEDDLSILRSQEKIDYENILDSQTLFIRISTTLQPEERREQIRKLPAIVRQHRATEDQLEELHASIERLYGAHHALALDAEGSSGPQSMKAKLAELAEAGSSLGKFYASLSTQ